MAGIKLNVDANINTTDLDSQVADIASEFNSIAAAIARANNLKFNPVTNATLADVQKMTANYKEMLKLQANLRERMKATGQDGATFEHLDFDRMYTDPAQAHRARINAYRRVTNGTPFNMQSYDVVPNTRPPANSPAGPPTNQVGPYQHHDPRAERWSNTIPGHIIGAGLRGAGPAGGVAASALDTGMTAGIGAGVGGLLGGLAALGLGKLVSGVTAKIGDAQQEAIGIDTLKRTVGDVGVDFVGLREKVRAVAESMGMTFDETRKVATEFAKLTGVVKPGELVTAVGFGRSFGLDPAQSGQSFGRLRQAGATVNETDSKRLALNIAEAIGRAGVFHKADEMLHAVASFAEQTASNSFSRGNTGSYLGALSGLAGSGLAGITPASAAAILGRANSAIQGGGAAGEAGQNFLYRALNGDRKLSPFEAKLMQEGGLFGTRSGVLGKGSLYQQYTGKSFEGKSTVFDAIRAQLGTSYNDPRLRAMAMSNLTGVNNSQAMALDHFAGKHGEGKVGQLADFLKSKNIDLAKVNAGGMGALGAIVGGNMDTLKSQAQSLFGRTGAEALSGGESERLKEAIKVGDKEELRKVLLELTATRDQEKTEGSQTRDSIAGLANITQRAATMLVGPINTMRDALVLLAGGGTKGAAGIADAVRKIERAETARTFDAESSQIIDTHSKLVGGARAQAATARARAGMAERGDGKYADMPAAERDAVIKAAKEEAKAADALDIGAADKQRDAALAEIKGRKNKTLKRFDSAHGDMLSGVSDQRRALIEQAGAANGVDPHLIGAVLQLENSGDKSVNKKSGAAGAFQIMPANVKAYGGDPFDFGSGARMASNVLKDAARIYPGNVRAQIAYYNGGKKAGNAVAAGGNAPTEEGRNYVARFDAMRTPMPDGAPVGAGAGQQTVNVIVKAEPFRVIDKNGKQIGASKINVHADAPAAAGTR